MNTPPITPTARPPARRLNTKLLVAMIEVSRFWQRRMLGHWSWRGIATEAAARHREANYRSAGMIATNENRGRPANRTPKEET